MGTSTTDRLERLRQRYATLAPAWTSSTARLERRVAAHLAPTARVLDLGCGRGGIVERLGYSGHWIGIDPDFASLSDHRLPLLVRACAPSEHLPFAPESFDLVVASWVLEHLPYPQATFCEIARVLKPGGRFVFLTPNARHPLPRLSTLLASLNRLQAQLVAMLYQRAPADTFPVAYLANTPQAIEHLAVATGLRLRELTFVEDPSYLACDDTSLVVAACCELLLPAGWQVHMVGELHKCGGQMAQHRRKTS